MAKGALKYFRTLREIILLAAMRNVGFRRSLRYIEDLLNEHDQQL